jgi:hypothetical protein
LKQIKVIAVIIVALCSISFADHPQSTEGPVTVSFHFPDGSAKEVTLTYKECSDIFVQKPLPKFIPVESYKVDWWIFAALQKLDLQFEIETVKKRTSITRIGEYKNDEKVKWIYYVNGVRSRYHINTQLDEDVKTIKFDFEKVPPS